MTDRHDENSGLNVHQIVPELAHCLVFLTRFPLPERMRFVLPPLNQAIRQFPVIGALIGCTTGIQIVIGLAIGLPSVVAVTLSILMTVLITGGLHEDGLADAADGLGAMGSAERKLAIMRDSRIGTFGVLALIFAILLKILATSSMSSLDPLSLIASLSATGALSRALMVWLMQTSAPARSDGLAVNAGKPTHSAMTYALGLGTFFTAVIFWSALGWLAGFIVPLVGFISAVVVRHLSNRHIGGHTGDICGALQVSSETLMLIAVSAIHS